MSTKNETISLDTFICSMRADIELFEKYWKEENKRTPENFPMEFGIGNEGLWLEQFLIFSGLE